MASYQRRAVCINIPRYYLTTEELFLCCSTVLSFHIDQRVKYSDKYNCSWWNVNCVIFHPVLCVCARS